VSSPISVSLRDHDRSIEDAYLKLFPGDPDKSPALIEWRALGNPHGRTRYAVASRGGEIVGMIALIPTRLRNAPGDILGYQAVDTVVDPSCRGQGLFVRMGELAQDPEALGGELLWGFPNANAAPGWFGRLGWTNLGTVPLLMRPLRSSFLLGRLHPRLRSIDFPLIRRRADAASVYDDPAGLSGDVDQLWRCVGSEFGVAVDRSGEWMRWRLADKPGADYRCVGIRSGTGDLQAFVASKIADKHGARLCYVMEAMSLPQHRGTLAGLLLSELARAASQGAEAALAWCPKRAPNYRAYRKAGFLPVPARLRPIEINFGARALTSGAAAAAAPGAHWYVSFLDSDTN
jgi:hypothetical protein